MERARISSGSIRARNRGAGFQDPADMQLLRAMLRRADVFIHNLAPGAVERAGLRLTELPRTESAIDHLRDQRLW